MRNLGARQCDRGFIQKLKQERIAGQRFSAAQYRLLNPQTSEPLVPSSTGTLLYSNQLHYFTVPECIFLTKNSIFAELSAAEKRLYTALAWFAIQQQADHFEVKSIELQRMAGLGLRGLKSALSGLEDRQLVSEQGFKPSIRCLEIHLSNPESGILLSESKWGVSESREQNWYEVEPTGVMRPAKFKLSPEDSATLFKELIAERGEYATNSGDEFRFRCPFHKDSTASCNFNPRKGCFHCFGCSAKGSTRTLLGKLLGDDPKDLYKRIAKTKGKEVTFRNPDQAKIIYRYLNGRGYLQKEVVVCRDEHGRKKFLQRTPSRTSADGWRYKAEGLAPMLYNLHLLEYAPLVVITEGEKDAETITNLHMSANPSGKIIGTTSGGADSWKEEFTKDLNPLMQRIVICPDDDDAGTRYADSIERSLRSRGFNFRRITFEGTGCKDVTEFIERHSPEDLARLIGLDWIHDIDDRRLEDPGVDALNECNTLPESGTPPMDCDDQIQV